MSEFSVTNVPACPRPRCPLSYHLSFCPLPSCLQSSAPRATTTTPASIAAFAAPWAPTSQTSVRTSAPAARGIQALTLMAPPAWPSARVRVRPGCGEWREISEPCTWEKGEVVNHREAGLVSGWAGSQVSPTPSANCSILSDTGRAGGGWTQHPREQVVT